MTWGRTNNPSFTTKSIMIMLFIFAPFIVSTTIITNKKYQGSLLETFQSLNINDYKVNLQDLFTTFIIYGMWITLQIILYCIPDLINKIIPRYRGGVQRGQSTPAGNVLEYNINGLQAFLITHIILISTYSFGIIPLSSPSYIVDHLLEFFYVMNVFGYALTFFAYFKARVFPSHIQDNKYSGSTLYDIIMGVEFNPRIGNFDFKLFFNGRPGIVLWSILNLCYACKQYETFGYVSWNMYLLIFLQSIYILDFFWHETWYLKTIDIAHDHFGFYLAWGDLVWLPFIYTLQGYYLSSHIPYHTNTFTLFYVLFVLGCFGYVLFRWSNYQKDSFKQYIEEHLYFELSHSNKYKTSPSINTNLTTYVNHLNTKQEISNISSFCVLPQFKLFGFPAKVIPCTYFTLDKKERASYLLMSGFWGISRHINYTGDVILSSVWGLCCGFQHFLPHFYTLYIILLLTTRTIRDENKCKYKYKDKWEMYCNLVPNRFIPRLI